MTALRAAAGDQPRREQGRAVHLARPPDDRPTAERSRRARNGTRSDGPSSCGSSRPTSTARCRNPPARSGPRFRSARKTSRPWAERRSAAKSRSCFPTSPTVLGWISCSTCPGRPAPRTRVPAFLGLNFAGNHAIHPDPGITLSRQWMRNDPDKGVVNHQATEVVAGSRLVALAGRANPRARLRPGDGLLRRPRPGLRRRVQERDSSALLSAGPDSSRGRRVGLDRRLGLGPLPGPRLPRDRARDRRRARSSSWAIRGWARRRSGPGRRTRGSRS